MEYGKTPLHIASKHGHTEIVRYLIEYGVSLNEKDNIGCTVLHYASYYNYVEIIEVLIKKWCVCKCRK
jgi:ankyrin repeat protein